MDRQAAKELPHIQGWLERVDEIVTRGEGAYLADTLLQEAGDSLMMKTRRSRPPTVSTRRPRAEGRRVGARGGESQFHHPPVRRDQS